MGKIVFFFSFDYVCLDAYAIYIYLDAGSMIVCILFVTTVCTFSRFVSLDGLGLDDERGLDVVAI